MGAKCDTYSRYTRERSRCFDPLRRTTSYLEADSFLTIRFQGLTVYRALKYSETNPSEWIVIPGAGGGLGHLGMY